MQNDTFKSAQSLKTFCLLITVPNQILSGRHQQPFVQFHPDQREVPAKHAKNQRKIRKIKQNQLTDRINFVIFFGLYFVVYVLNIMHEPAMSRRCCHCRAHLD